MIRIRSASVYVFCSLFFAFFLEAQLGRSIDNEHETLKEVEKTPADFSSFLWGDYDEDGLPDFLALELSGIRLFHNEGGGEFFDVTDLMFRDGAGKGSAGAWGDLDDDGLLDLFVCHPEGCSVYRNTATGGFVESARSMGIDPSFGGFQSILFDLDGDGFQDLIVTGEKGQAFFRNQGGGTFSKTVLRVPRSIRSVARTVGGTSRSASATRVDDSSETDDPLELGACVEGLTDQSGGSCIRASRNPVCGQLYPLSSDFFVTPSGRVGIGTKNPGHLLTVRGSTAPSAGVTDGEAGISISVATQNGFFSNIASEDDVVLRTEAGASGDLIVTTRNANSSAIRFATGTTVTEAERMIITEAGRVGIGTSAPESALHVAGTVTTSVLTVTGGGDLAEPFHIVGDEKSPGSVVCIDADNPGSLRLSRDAYETSVVGVISGAGGVRPGVVLSQEGVLTGETEVALAGRVYCWCDASLRPIRPGDLLVTSEVPGCAMAVEDPARSSGALVGKALTCLEEGRGLVLVIVKR